jgi:iron-sulfur cluster repair protein YtfE (RIC family)
MKFDQQPKPTNPEIVAAEKLCEEMRQIAKKLPKPQIKREAWEQTTITNFGNNFSMLFHNIHQRNLDPNYSIANTRFEKIQDKYGSQWKKFAEENAVLLAKIENVMSKEDMYDELSRRMLQLYGNLKTIELGKQICQEINIDGISEEIKSELVPLLKEVSEAMEQYGINPKDFYS